MNDVETNVQLDVFQILYRIWNKKILILISIIISIVIGVYFSNTDTRVYRISLPLNTISSDKIDSEYGFFNTFDIVLIDQIPLINRFSLAFLNRENVKSIFKKYNIVKESDYSNTWEYDEVVENEINNIAIIPPILLRLDRFLYPDQPWSQDYNIVYITDKLENKTEAKKFIGDLILLAMKQTRADLQTGIEGKIKAAQKAKKNEIQILEESLIVHNRTQAKLITKAIFILNENLRIARVLNIVEPLEIILGERDITRKSTTDDFDSLPVYTDGTKAIEEHIANLEIRLTKISSKDLFLSDTSIYIDNEILALAQDDSIKRFRDSYEDINMFEDLIPIKYEINQLKFKLYNTPKTITSILLSLGLFIFFIFIISVREVMLQKFSDQKNKLSKV